MPFLLRSSLRSWVYIDIRRGPVGKKASRLREEARPEAREKAHQLAQELEDERFKYLKKADLPQ